MSRMMKMAAMVAVLAMVAVPAVAQGPGRGMGPGHRMGQGMMRGGPAMMQRNPAAVVLDHQEELELTDAQVQQVQQIRDHLEQENAPRIERIMDEIGDIVPSELSIEERYEFQQKMRELQPVREEIRNANREAGQQIHELLNDDQERTLFGIMHADRPGRGDRGMHRRRPAGPRGPRGGG